MKIDLPREKIEAFCRQWDISRMDLFGSFLREDFGPESDIDFLVTFLPDSRWSLLDLVRMQQELSVLLGRKVDLVERSTIENSYNWIRRKEILDSAKLFIDLGQRHAA